MPAEKDDLVVLELELPVELLEFVNTAAALAGVTPEEWLVDFLDEAARRDIAEATEGSAGML